MSGKLVVDTKEGPVPAQVLQAQAKAMRRPQPTYADSLQRLGIPESQQRAQELQPAADAAPAAPTKQTDRAQLDRIPVANLDRAIEIAKAKSPADVPYLMQRKQAAARRV